MHRFPSVLLCAFCFMSDLSPGSYRDLNLRAQLSLSALLLTRTSVVHLLWQAQALLALAQTHWIAALDCTAETSQSSNALMSSVGRQFTIVFQQKSLFYFILHPCFIKYRFDLLLSQVNLTVLGSRCSCDNNFTPACSVFQFSWSICNERFDAARLCA